VRDEDDGAEEERNGEQEGRDLVALVCGEGGDGDEVEQDAQYRCDEEGFADRVERVAAIWQAAFCCAVHGVEVNRRGKGTCTGTCDRGRVSKKNSSMLCTVNVRIEDRAVCGVVRVVVWTRPRVQVVVRVGCLIRSCYNYSQRKWGVPCDPSHRQAIICPLREHDNAHTIGCSVKHLGLSGDVSYWLWLPGVLRVRQSIWFAARIMRSSEAVLKRVLAILLWPGMVDSGWIECNATSSLLVPFVCGTHFG
jgi:hypothetical protein